MHKRNLYLKAVNLRKTGHSLVEIASTLNIAKSTASLWVGKVYLNKFAKERLLERRLEGNRKSTETKRKRITVARDQSIKWARKTLAICNQTTQSFQIYCSLLYWAEGGKFTDNRLEFTNSDPVMIKFYLKSLRKGFRIDETKLRANIHLHEYHNEEIQKKFWSEVTNIPLSQFNKSFLKRHTGKNTRQGYQGCIRICYHSAVTARKIKAIYTTLAEKLT
jgi:hypothetical protein